MTLLQGARAAAGRAIMHRERNDFSAARSRRLAWTLLRMPVTRVAHIDSHTMPLLCRTPPAVFT